MNTKIENTEEILAILKDKDSSFQNVNNAILSIDSAEELFDIEAYGEEPARVDYFDGSIRKYIKQFDDKTLVHIVKTTFTDTSLLSSMQATIIAVDEITERENIDTQIEVADVFLKCSCYYDGGHINYTNSVHEYFLAEFHGFEAAAIAHLLKELRDDLLREDEMDELFGTFFTKNTDTKKEEEVLDRYLSYLEESYFEYKLNEDDIDKLQYQFEEILEQKVSKKVHETVTKLMKKLEV